QRSPAGNRGNIAWLLGGDHAPDGSHHLIVNRPGRRGGNDKENLIGTQQGYGVAACRLLTDFGEQGLDARKLDYSGSGRCRRLHYSRIGEVGLGGKRYPHAISGDQSDYRLRL